VARLDDILKDHECKLSEKEEGSKQVEASLLKLQLENEESQRRLVELNTELSDKTNVYEDSLSQVWKFILDNFISFKLLIQCYCRRKLKLN
jgi:hypothetical protein